MVKNVGAKWLVEMSEYISDNPHFIVNSFIRSGITGALDDTVEDDSEHVSSEADTDTSESDFEDSQFDTDSWVFAFCKAVVHTNTFVCNVQYLVELNGWINTVLQSD